MADAAVRFTTFPDAKGEIRFKACQAQVNFLDEECWSVRMWKTETRTVMGPIQTMGSIFIFHSARSLVTVMH